MFSALAGVKRWRHQHVNVRCSMFSALAGVKRDDFHEVEEKFNHVLRARGGETKHGRTIAS